MASYFSEASKDRKEMIAMMKESLEIQRKTAVDQEKLELEKRKKNGKLTWNDINNGKLVKQNGNFEVTAGVVYHFKTSNGKHSIAMPRLYDAAEVAALNARINELMKRPAVVKEVVKEVSVYNYNS